MTSAREGGAAYPRSQARHKEILRLFLSANPNYRATGFKSAIRSIGYSFRFVPDAYEIDADARCATLVEVENTHPITNEKARAIAALCRSLDADSWTLRLYVMDRNGSGYFADMPVFLKHVDALNEKSKPRAIFGVPIPLENLMRAVKCMEFMRETGR